MAAIQIGLAVVAVLVAVLIILVLARKALRDRRESRTAARRESYQAAMQAGGTTLKHALAGARGSRSQLDLVCVLDAERPRLTLEDQWSLERAATNSGLTARLNATLTARSPVRRGCAVLLLSRLQLPTNVTTLAPLLHDPDPDVRRVACAGIALIKNVDGVRVLVDAVTDRHLAPERMIENLAHTWAVPALLEALEALDTHSEHLILPRASIARALGLALDVRAAPALESLLQRGALEERISAARALGTAGTATSRPALERAVADPAWELRAQAAKALGELRDERSVPALNSALDDRAWWVRRNAANALRRLGPPGIAALRDALAHSDPYARDRAREELALDGAHAQPEVAA